MAFRGLALYRIVRNMTRIHHSAFSTVVNEVNISKPTKFATEKSFIYLEDPDTFGTLSGKPKPIKETIEDPGDIKELEYTETRPVRSQRLTIKQYADLIKQYVKYKRLKEAIDVLEVRMLKEDRVKPENYIYNILIGACADVGYTKKAFKLFNDMKRRALKPTGDTYTCLFQACINSPWALDGLNKAKHLRELMVEKQIEPNLTNYNAMIKAFGRCGDLATAFQIVDEMISKKIKIRVHTLNHLLHACITDKGNGLRHALLVWRKMLKLREKPNIYSFNLMLKCVKECDLGSKEDFQELISLIQQDMPLAINSGHRVEILQMKGSEHNLLLEQNIAQLPKNVDTFIPQPTVSQKLDTGINKALNQKLLDTEINTDSVPKDLAITENPQISMQFLDKTNKKPAIKEPRTVPNILSRVINMQQVLSLQEITTTQDKFNIIGGQEDFLKEMEFYSVKPDIKTFTQMLAVIEETREAELQLLETMKRHDLKVDIDFYNMLIKKRCLRSDYDGAFEVKQMIEKEQKQRKKKHFLKKRLHLKVNIMTYGVLAMACQTQESAEKLLAEMKEHQLKVNIQILGTLLRNGTANNQFSYIVYILEVVKEERVPVNQVFMRHLEEFNDKCSYFLKTVDENGKKVKNRKDFERGYKEYLVTYSRWLKEVELEEALKPEHPWQQFNEDYPTTVQKDKVEIVMPKKFYKRNRKYVKYVPRAS